MTHSMQLNPAPFEKIKSGAKTIGLRLNDEKRRRIKTGDKIEFVNNATGETLTAEAVALHRFDSFAELYGALSPEKFGYAKDGAASPEDMNLYYTPEKQAKYGALGIEIRVKNGL